jgi:hypothetical protein
MPLSRLCFLVRLYLPGRMVKSLQSLNSQPAPIGSRLFWLSVLALFTAAASAALRAAVASSLKAQWIAYVFLSDFTFRGGWSSPCNR